MKAKKFKAGEWVTLNSGGPDMKVREYESGASDEDPKCVICEWVDAEGDREDIFHEDMLTPKYESMTWSKLKEFCDGLNDEQLSKRVILWREDEAISYMTAEALEEDHFIDPEDHDNGCFPANETTTDRIPELKKVYDKGDPILFESF